MLRRYVGELYRFYLQHLNFNRYQHEHLNFDFDALVYFHNYVYICDFIDLDQQFNGYGYIYAAIPDGKPRRKFIDGDFYLHVHFNGDFYGSDGDFDRHGDFNEHADEYRYFSLPVLLREHQLYFYEHEYGNWMELGLMDRNLHSHMHVNSLQSL
jgi:hypothetical protein